MSAYDFYNIFAYTAPGSAPAFISINAVPEGLKFGVRYKGTADGNTGPQGEITLTAEQVREMIPKLQAWADEKAADNGDGKHG